MILPYFQTQQSQNPWQKPSSFSGASMRNPKSGLVVKKLIILETGTYNQGFRRPYTTNSQQNTLSIIQNQLEGVSSFTANMMSGIAGQFITPSGTVEKPIDIVGGWDRPRMRFMLETDHTDFVGATITEVILGYTDHNGITVSGALDPNMEFFINSVIRIRNSIIRTDIGNQSYSTVFDNSHILTNQAWANVYDSTPDHNLRPEDIYSTMTRTHLHGLGGTVDARNLSTNNAVKSRRANNLPGTYMANILQGYRASSTNLDEFGQNVHEVLNSARQHYGEPQTMEDPFLSAIASIRNAPIGNTFTLNDLRRLSPNLDQVTRAQCMAPTERVKAHVTGQTADWGASNRDSLVASILSQSVPALLMELGITKLTFVATNETFDSSVDIRIFESYGFNENLVTPTEIFMQRLRDDVLRDISFNNQTSYSIKMEVDLLGDTWIKMMLDGNAEIDFVTPSFCDALTVPVITSSDDLNVAIASDFEALIGTLDDSPRGNSFGSFGTKSNSFGNI